MLNVASLEKFKDLMEKAESYIWENPELGFKEEKTNKYMIDAFEKLGYKLDRPTGITGFSTTIDTGREGPTLMILSELDSVLCRTHPNCDKETGAVHACGHNVQCAVMLGIANALKEKGALDGLSGKIKLCVVPAEEGCEISFRKKLRESGKISFLTGKPEFISRGFMDDVDLAFMVHVTNKKEDYDFSLDEGHNGVIRKKITFLGKSSHAANPHEGINALHMATSAINIINNFRDTFIEKDMIRFHYIITKGGDIVNTVPDVVEMESYVRSSNVQGLFEVNTKINKALGSVALAFGGNVQVEDFPGSFPLIDDVNLNDVAAEVIEEEFGKNKCKRLSWNAGSTDMGDVASIIPSIHAYVNCTSGACHGADYMIKDNEIALTKNLKFQVGLINKLMNHYNDKLTLGGETTFRLENKNLESKLLEIGDGLLVCSKK